MFVPVKTIAAGEASSQRIHPAVTDDGVPIWQEGDGDVASWDLESIGWCHGAAANRRDTAGIKGRVYLTRCRAVVTSVQFAKGSRYRAYGVGNQVLVAAAASKISQKRAQRQAAGSVLCGQVRLPWLSGVIFAPTGSPKGLRGEVRLRTQHVTEFGDAESVMLIFRLRRPHEIHSFVAAVLERARQDRYDWKDTTDAERTALDRVADPADAVGGNGHLPLLPLAGSFRVSGGSASRGVYSSRSFDAPEA